MAYTLIFIRRESTDSNPYTLNLSKPVFYGALGALLGLPLIGFFLATFFLAPSYMDNEVTEIRTGYKESSAKLAALEETHKNILETHDFLQEELAKEREVRAEAEAHITIAESARAEAVSSAQELEKKLSDKDRELVFYQAFVKPQTEQKDLQCFNISATFKKGQLNYGVNFLRTDQKAKNKIKSTVKYRLLVGEDVIDLNEGREFVPPVHSQDMSMVKQNRLTGKFKASVPNEGLRILDIKAYDRSDRVIAHCWKAF